MVANCILSEVIHLQPPVGLMHRKAVNATAKQTYIFQTD